VTNQSLGKPNMANFNENTSETRSTIQNKTHTIAGAFVPRWGVDKTGNSADNSRDNEDFEPNAWTGEVPQNVVDAILASLSFGILDIQIKKMRHETISSYFGELQPHHEACYKEDKILYKKADFHSQDCWVLVLEDFNTTGLLGPFGFLPDGDKYKQNFVTLMRTNGDMNTKAGGLGSRNQGKITISAASKGFCWLAYTVRAPHDTPDKEPRALMGRTRLRPHWIDQSHYQKDGHWGIWNQDNVLPCTDDGIIDKFVTDFGLKRKAAQTGTSIVIPFYNGSSEPVDLVRQLIERNYALFVMSRLQVNLEVEENPKPYELNCASLLNIIQDCINSDSSSRSDEWYELKARVEYLTSMLKARENDDKHIKLPAPNRPKSFSEYLKDLPEELQKKLVTTYNVDGKLVVTIPVEVTENKDDSPYTHTGQLDIAIFQDSDVAGHWPEFLRDGLRIAPIDRRSRSRMGNKISGVFSIVLVTGGENNGLQKLLRASEPGAHDKWKKDNAKFRETWPEGAKWVDFAKGAPEELVEFLKGNKESLDFSGFNFLSDPNANKTPEGGTDTGSGSKGRGRKTKPKPVVKPKPKPVVQSGPEPHIQGYVDHGRGCIEVTIKDIKADTLKVSAAYDTDLSGVFTKHDRADFDFEVMHAKGDIAVENGSLTKLDKNSFLVDVFDSDSFKLVIKGFDIRRVPVLKVDAYNKTELPTVASRTK